MEITVSVSEETGKLIFREAIGDGHCEGYEFELSSTIPNHNLYIALDDKAYIVSVVDVVQAVVAAYIEDKEATTES